MDIIDIAMAKALAGGGGLPLVEVETTALLVEPQPLSESDYANLKALNGGLCALKVSVSLTGKETPVTFTGFPLSQTAESGVLYLLTVIGQSNDGSIATSYVYVVVSNTFEESMIMWVDPNFQ